MAEEKAAGQADVQRTIESRRFLDPQRVPAAMVDEVLPTSSKNLLVLKRGRVRAPRGTIQGSMRITGSMRPFNPGTFSLRVTRVSVFTGSRNMAWAIRHSRTGTQDVQQFSSPGQVDLRGGPMTPVYSFGPGTVFWGFIGNAGGAMGSA